MSFVYVMGRLQAILSEMGYERNKVTFKINDITLNVMKNVRKIGYFLMNKKVLYLKEKNMDLI